MKVNVENAIAEQRGRHHGVAVAPTVAVVGLIRMEPLRQARIVGFDNRRRPPSPKNDFPHRDTEHTWITCQSKLVRRARTGGDAYGGWPRRYTESMCPARPADTVHAIPIDHQMQIRLVRQRQSRPRPGPREQTLPYHIHNKAAGQHRCARGFRRLGRGGLVVLKQPAVAVIAKALGWGPVGQKHIVYRQLDMVNCYFLRAVAPMVVTEGLAAGCGDELPLTYRMTARSNLPRHRSMDRRI